MSVRICPPEEVSRFSPLTTSTRSEVDWSSYQVSLSPCKPRCLSAPAAVPACPIARGVALVLDMLMIFLPQAFGLYFLADTLARPEVDVLRVPWVQVGTLMVIIGQAALLALRGQTIGKMAVGVRVVRHCDGSNAGFWRAFVLRQLVPAAILGLPFLGVIALGFLGSAKGPGPLLAVALFPERAMQLPGFGPLFVLSFLFLLGELLTLLGGDENRCLHDVIAGTKVVDV